MRGTEVEDIESAFTEHPGVKGIRLVDSVADEYLLRVEWAQDYDDVLTILAETAVPLIEATGTNQQWTFEIRGDDRRYNLVTAASSTHDQVYRPTTHRQSG